MANRVALVTGGGRGIGRAVVRALAREGVISCALDCRKNPEGEEAVRESGGAFYEGDVSDLASVERVVGELLKRWERLDVLVNCAGISRDARLWKMTSEMWHEVLEVNLTGCWNTIRAAVPTFRNQKGGKVVNVASTLAIRAREGLSNYIASKSGLVGLTRAAARDLAPFGVNVNAVAPGFVDTELTQEVSEEVRGDLLNRTPTGRITQPEDVADVIVFLCSDKARQITGEVIRVDGGFLA
jgi:3-oxoacyl-[acyl-carrier protein] reductase